MPPLKSIDKKSPLIWFVVSLLIIAGVTLLGPAEKSLGTNVRVVYLHGAWVWAALIGFFAAAAAGLVGLLTGRALWNHWSRALGRTGLFFWVTYLPISLWAMQTNWNGLFLAEPRWRVALVFAIGGLLLQVGVTLMGDPRWASLANIGFVAGLWLTLQNTAQVMHPPSPIAEADSQRIQYFFVALTLLTLLAAFQVARWWRHYERV